MTGSTIAAAWHYQPHMPNAEQANKGQESGARRSIENAITQRGEPFNPTNIRPMTDAELARTPMKPAPGVELRGLIYDTTQETLL